MTRFFTFLFFSLILFSFNALALIETYPSSLSLENKFNLEFLEEQATSESVQKLMGHLSLAIISIDYKLKTSAIDHLESARAEADGLIKNVLNTSKELKLPFGIFRYGKGSGEEEYYLPIWLSEGTSEKVIDHSKGKNSKIEIQEISIVQILVRLNVKRTLELLTQAQDDLGKDKYDTAKEKLEQIYDETIISENVVKDPLMMLWGNMVLARDFMSEGNYKNAKFTLNKVKISLKQLEKDKVLKKNEADVISLYQELEQISKELDQKAPGMMKRVKGKMKDWTIKMKQWI